MPPTPWIAAAREAMMLDEFKKFALRGNVVDLAVGVIIGAAFGGIVQSLVADLLMPIVGAVIGGLDFSNHFIALSSKVTADTLAEAKKQGAVLAWGNFLTLVINFVIVAFILFVVIRLMNRLVRAEAAKAPAPTRQEELLTEIRDLLKSPAK
jgi:large conductance mechanosensitive channel